MSTEKIITFGADGITTSYDTVETTAETTAVITDITTTYETVFAPINERFSVYGDDAFVSNVTLSDLLISQFVIIVLLGAIFGTLVFRHLRK